MNCTLLSDAAFSASGTWFWRIPRSRAPHCWYWRPSPRWFSVRFGGHATPCLAAGDGCNVHAAHAVGGAATVARAAQLGGHRASKRRVRRAWLLPSRFRLRSPCRWSGVLNCRGVATA